MDVVKPYVRKVKRLAATCKCTRHTADTRHRTPGTARAPRGPGGTVDGRPRAPRNISVRGRVRGHRAFLTELFRLT